MPETLTDLDKTILLKIARDALEDVVAGKKLIKLAVDDYPPHLQAIGASFVTLTKNKQLRGCIGTLEAYQPLVKDVQQRAFQAAMEDPRFDPVTSRELPFIQIEISRLTKPEPLIYHEPEELLKLLKPGRDGVILQDGFQRATFLPQVWDQLPKPDEFLNHLCLKMGARSSLWRQKILDVSTYQVEEFHE